MLALFLAWLKGAAPKFLEAFFPAFAKAFVAEEKARGADVAKGAQQQQAADDAADDKAEAEAKEIGRDVDNLSPDDLRRRAGDWRRP